MKNKIEGYGDEWIIPNRSVLMNWQKIMNLQMQARNYKKPELTKSLIKLIKQLQGLYVEQNRRNTAINFVLDAFNGRVDSILSKVKHNNFGKLSQEIKRCISTCKLQWLCLLGPQK